MTIELSDKVELNSGIKNLSDWSRPSLVSNPALVEKVSVILSDIKAEGDERIDFYSQEFDKQEVKIIGLKAFHDYELEETLARSIKTAATRIDKFAQFQKASGTQTNSFSDDCGEYGQCVIPIERIGAYIPGGRFPLISTALMTLIPAKVAKCPVRIACSPSNHPALLAAASLAGATKFIHIGGVQAIAALAYGYSGEEPVDLVVGPGNTWVNEAKNQIQSKTKIDGLAGPSELLALCDGEQNIEYLALDALAQSEHDPLACSIIVSDNLAWLKGLEEYLNKNDDTTVMLENTQIELLLAGNQKEMLEFSNQYAPEHLMLCHKKINEQDLVNYGSLFIGENSAVAFGDYIAGPNHTLPTLTNARQYGGLSVSSFQKVVTKQVISNLGTSALADSAMPIAKAEGLKFHYQSMKVRNSSIN
ncbi:MAG: histidinol dehydrogenase [Kangiellaceae bacterium]|nr:histidinol dehydrogenase [Kangiellaceae bacterium]